MSRWIKNWFSNYEPFDEPLIYQNLEFTCPETFYQAMKSRKELFWVREKISKLTPGKAKRFWRKKENKQYLRPDWYYINHEVMEYALRYKFARGTSWYIRLMKETGEIVETNNWHDNYWGNCICQRCRIKSKYNHLGKLLMKLREEFLDEEKKNER